MLISITSIVRFYLGWIKNFEFTKYDNYLATALLITLYMQMMMGVYLFYDKLSGTIVIQNNSLENRFWPVEHFFVMFFSILTAQLGYIYAKNLKNSQNRFKTLTIYYSISLVLVVFSLTMILL
jgi:H+/Cl- antiporter ClcA